MPGAAVFGVLLALVTCSASWHLNETQLLVQVYYESLCPYSIKWISTQLGSTFNAIGSENMAVQLVPYGKAAMFKTGDDIAFRCEHGTKECVGNKYQACGLARLSESNEKQVNFVVCVMNQTDPSNPGAECADEVGLSHADLTSCASGTEGVFLEASMAPITPTIDASQELPYVLFDKNSVEEPANQYKIEVDFLDPVCDYLTFRTMELPKACSD